MAGLDPAIHLDGADLMKIARRLVVVPFMLSLTACATPSGVPATRIAEPAIAAAYLPLSARVHLGMDRAAGAAVMIAPGVAVTNAHNANLVGRKNVIGTATLSDLMFFRANGGPPPATAVPTVGGSVTAYGQDTQGKLRFATGVVRQIVMTPGYAASPYFIFFGDAGPGFSGGPVIDASGKLIGITFGYTGEGKNKPIYAYDMARVRAEYSALQNAQKAQ
jgi:S1-C subfamily serine protease